MALKYRIVSPNDSDFVFLSSIEIGDFSVDPANRAFTTVSIVGVGTQTISNIKAAMVFLATNADCQIDIESPSSTRKISFLIRSGRGGVFHIFDTAASFNLVIRNNSAGTVNGNVIATADTPNEISINQVNIGNIAAFVDAFWDDYVARADALLAAGRIGSGVAAILKT